MIPGMVEDNQMILALGRPQPAPDRLHEPEAGPGLPLVYYKSIERCNIANKLSFAGAEPVKGLLAHKHFGVAVDVFGGDAGFDEALLKVLGVLAVYAHSKASAGSRLFRTMSARRRRRFLSCRTPRIDRPR